MLAALFIFSIVAVSLSTEQVSCVKGKKKCKSLNSITANNKYYCCKKGFTLRYTSEGRKKTGTCVCDKQTQESDCLEGNEKCRNSNNSVSNGYTIKCCPNGYSISSISNSYINGVMVNYCKCMRFGSSGIINSRPMTKEELAIFQQTMGNVTKNVDNQMKQMQQTINQSLGNVNTNLGSVLGEGILNGLTQNLNQAANVLQASLQAGINQAIRASNIAQQFQPRLPWQGSSWDLQQRRLQQLQRRLNGGGWTFWDRLSRNPAMAQMMSPSWWFSNIWNGLYGNRNQTA